MNQCVASPEVVEPLEQRAENVTRAANRLVVVATLAACGAMAWKQITPEVFFATVATALLLSNIARSHVTSRLLEALKLEKSKG